MRFRERAHLKEYIKLPEMKGSKRFQAGSESLDQAVSRGSAGVFVLFGHLGWIYDTQLQRNTSARSCSDSLLKTFPIKGSILPFIQSTTWPELHLLTGSITSAMLRSLSPSGLTKGIPPTVPQKNGGERAAEIKTHESRAVPVNSRFSCATD